jgi:formylglycine-generating enzyme required for sulfatase activity
VDWCDAYYYCKGVGKRLCGAIKGGATPHGTFAQATISQWSRACTQGGTYTYPYGNTYEKDYCAGSENGVLTTGGTQLITSLSQCVTFASGYAGIYDLSGNVREWEDSCDGTASDSLCRVRGGSFYFSIGATLTCAADVDSIRTNVDYDIGFRCCSP